MPELVISEIMGAIKDIVDLATQLESRVKDRHDLETLRQIHSLAISLLAQQADVAERDVAVMQENAKLRERVQQLEADAKRSKNLKFEDAMYWVLNEKQEKEGPFCAVCYDNDNKLIHLHNATRQGWKWLCPICKKGWIEEGRSPSLPITQRPGRDRSILG